MKQTQALRLLGSGLQLPSSNFQALGTQALDRTLMLAMSLDPHSYLDDSPNRVSVREHVALNTTTS